MLTTVLVLGIGSQKPIKGTCKAKLESRGVRWGVSSQAKFFFHGLAGVWIFSRKSQIKLH